MNRFAALLLLVTGCTHVAATTPDPDHSQSAERMTFSATLSQIDVTTKDQLSAVKEQTELLRGIKSEIEKLNTEASGDDPTEPENGKAVIPESAGETGTTAKESDESGSPVLFVAYAPFTCPPCDQLKSDVAAGKFDGIDVKEELKPGTEARGYPVLRWKKPDGLDKWVNGYDQNTLAMVKRELLGTKKLVSAQEILCQPEPVRQIVVQRMSGPSWTWPGDLATHLSTTHGVDVSGMSFSDLKATHDNLHNAQRGYATAMPTRRVQYVRRSGSYCPGGNCP